MNEHNNFNNYVFGDETSCCISCPLYQWRHPAKQPKAVKKTFDRKKINIWGAISAMGASEFVVSYCEINLFNIMLQIFTSRKYECLRTIMKKSEHDLFIL